jgi:predicted permease
MPGPRIEFGRWRRSRPFRPDVNDEVGDEVAFHLDMRTRDYERRGHPPAEARRLAARDFGDADTVRRVCRDLGTARDTTMQRAQYWDEFRQDVRFAWRQLRAAPLFAVVALVTLVVGIGATTASFSLVRGVLFEPLPFTDPDRVVMARSSLPDFEDVQASARSFDRLAVYARNLETLGEGDEPEQLLAAQVSATFFETLGVSARLGRTFSAADGEARVVVLSEGLWRRRFGADPAMVGRTIDISRRPAVVVGVMPARFEFPSREFEMWLPLEESMRRATAQRENRALRIFTLVGRLRSGVTVGEAQAEVATIAARLGSEYPDTNRGVEIRLDPAHERMVGDTRRPLLLLFLIVGLVLLIVCANLANLLLARASVRDRELAVRSALGAGRGRIVRQLLTESALLSLAGGALGVAATYALLGALVRVISGFLPRVDAVRVDAPVLAFAFAVAVLSGLIFGALPALQGSRLSAWREAGRGVAGIRRGARVRGALIAVEVALAAVVLVSAGLVARSLSALMQVEPGFVADRLLTLNVVLAPKGDGPNRADAARAVARRLAELPGVVSVGGATGLPPQTAQRGTGFEVEGMTTDERPSAYFVAALPGYFSTIGAVVRRGREFTDGDTAGSPPVVIVNAALAKRLFGSTDPLGKRIRLINPEQSDAWRTIVGVVPDVRYRGLDDDVDAAVYTPFAQTPFLWTYLYVRTAGDPAAMTREVARAIRAFDAELTPARIRPMADLVAESVRARRTSTAFLSGFAVVAVMLAAIGIGGLVAYMVTQRTREIAVRLALGATHRRVAGLVAGQALVPVALGAVAGLVGAFFATRLLETLLFGVTPHDASTFALSTSMLVAVSIAAAYLPVRRALRISPSEALRAE